MEKSSFVIEKNQLVYATTSRKMIFSWLPPRPYGRSRVQLRSHHCCRPATLPLLRNPCDIFQTKSAPTETQLPGISVCMYMGRTRRFTRKIHVTTGHKHALRHPLGGRVFTARCTPRVICHQNLCISGTIVSGSRVARGARDGHGHGHGHGWGGMGTLWKGHTDA